MPMVLRNRVSSEQKEIANQFRGSEQLRKDVQADRPKKRKSGFADSPEHWEDMRTFCLFLLLAPFGLVLWIGLVWFLFWLF